MFEGLWEQLAAEQSVVSEKTSKKYLTYPALLWYCT